MKKITLALALIIAATTLQAQEHQHGHTKKETVPAKDTVPKKKTEAAAHDHATHDHGAPQKEQPAQQHHNMQEGEDHGAHNMSHAFSRNLPMNRNGSGTGWLPDESPMYGYMYHKKDWMYMLHGNVFVRYNKQDLLDKGSRGDAKVDMPSWAMLMGQRPVGKKGLFHFNVMASLDPLIAGGEGYPLLFQTGETWKDKPLVDRQHPHDLISELSVSYAHALSPKADVFVYVGYPGEPALGPVAFMHRPSALPNPDATLTHHWTDATHITFGVATLGVRYGNVKLEGSKFTGREPDENRYDFDKPRFDSWSGRLSYNPTKKLAAQVSHAFIKEPEPIHPGENVKRTTASVTYSTKVFMNNYFSATALWGVNKKDHGDGENAVLVEGTYTERKWNIYSRYEWVQKSAEELQLDENVYGHHSIFPVHAFTAGANYDVFNIGKTSFALGGHFTFFNPDKELSSLYGQNPLAGQLYLRIYPGRMSN